MTSWEEGELGGRRRSVGIGRTRSAENMFDELNYQWGWTGYVTLNLKRSQLMVPLVALVYNRREVF